MLLKALEIQGFKSFPDKTRITFDKGITAVVGPNGSGKSNISDAIRWVLGETSARQLRGGAKMENVIFGGTQQRGAMGFAAVNLVVDNADRRIDVDADEVIIGRKYYRSGESEYMINGQNVRLKDIYELFLDTGLGRDGYSIIGQGRIAEIVGAKSNERREIFEEASGIAKYRYRKNEAERRLASTEENLVRLRDILAELESRVGPLERDSKKAQAFLELAQRRKELEVTLWVDTVQKAQESLRGQQRKIEIADADYARLEKEIAEIDASTEETRLEILRLSAEGERKSTEVQSLREQLGGAQAQIAVLQNNIQHNDAAAADLQAEINAVGEGKESLAQQMQQQTDSIAGGQRADEEFAARIAEQEALLMQLQTKSAQTGERKDVVTARLAQLTAQVTDMRVQTAAAQSAQQTAGERLHTAKAEQEAAAQAAEGLLAEKADTDAFMQRVQQQLTQLDNIKSGLSMKLQSRREALRRADEAEQALVRDIESARQRIQLLKDLDRNMDGFNHSVKTVMKAHENHRLRGITGPVSSVLTVQSGYETAVETALGAAMQNIVVENETAAKAAMAFLRDEKAGRATFLPLDTVKPSRFSEQLPAGAKLASQLVQADSRYADIVSNLLGRIVVVQDINEASRTARSLGYRYRVVTVDGQVVNAGGSFTGGSVSRSAGLFSRKQEIEDLKAKAEKLEKKRAEAEAVTDKAKAETDALTAELTAAESEAITAGNDKVRAEMETSRIHAAVQANAAAQQTLQAECAALAQSIAQNRELAAQSDQALTRLNAEIAQLEAELTAISGDDDSFLATRTRLSDELSSLRLQQLENQKNIALCRAALDTLRQRTGENDERTQQQAQNIARLQAQSDAYRDQIAQIEAAMQQGSETIAAKEAEVQALAARRYEMDAGIETQNRRIREIQKLQEDAAREKARLEEQQNNLQQEYDGTISRLWEEYEISFSDAQALCIAFESVTELRRNVAEVRGKIKALGNVNVGAIEEYKEVSQRYEFMRAQVTDVETAKAELLQMITGLSDEMRTLFMQSFAQINKNFARIFTELFGGGTASLSLSEPENVLDSGINIEVAPPGKVIKNLSALSGGEQSLVAIAIYFAILAVNPAPFCILDEIEAALDDVNVTRYAQYLRRITHATQFIVITHRRGTMEEADVLYGVTMQEDGVSKLLRLDLANVDASLVS